MTRTRSGRPASLGRAGILGMAFVLATTLAGCLDANVPSAAPTSRFTPEPTAGTAVYVLGSKVWYAGLVVTIDRVAATLDAHGGPVDVLVGVANPGREPTELSGPVTLLVGGKRIDPTRESHIPTVPAAGSVATVLTFELQAVSSVDDAIIEIGADPQHVARVPITPAAGKLVAYEPIALPLSGSATASNLKLTLKSAAIRWDLPDWFEELDSGLEALTITYDATYSGDFGGGLPFTGDNVALRLPDGTVIGARRDGHSQSVELIGAHKTKKSLSTRFEIPFGLTGSFALLVRNSGTQKAIPFTIKG